MAINDRTNFHQIFEVSLRGATGETTIDNAAIASIYFIEDIYSWCKCGKMILSDTQAIWEFLPLVGDEELTITYQTLMEPGPPPEYEQKRYTFSIYKIGEITDPSPASVGTRDRKTKYAVEVFFVEKEFYLLHMPHYSRTYIDLRYYDIIKDMVDRYLGGLTFVIDEDSEEMCEFFHTGLRTPAENIRWLHERTKGNFSGEPGYLFYSNTEETEESWNFCTLEYLLADAPLLTIPGDGIYYIGGAQNFYSINNINNLSISGMDKSTIDKLARCNYLGYDIYRKYMVKREYDYFMSKDHFTVLGNYTLFNGDVLLADVMKPQEVLTGESGDKYMLVECLMDNMYFGDWIKQYCLQQLVAITVWGHCLRYAGGQIEINWLSSNTDEKWNKQMIGRYLIKSITHQFSAQTQPNYIQKMVLIKNSYYDTDAPVTIGGKINDASVPMAVTEGNASPTPPKS